MDRRDSSYYEHLAAKLYSAVLADVLDDLGARDQVFAHTLRPLDPATVVCGRAATMLATAVWDVPAEPYKLEMEGIDRLQPGEVLVATCSGATHAALWGELLSTSARARGARGVVIDGFTRDSKEIIQMGFPVFATGLHPGDSKGRIEVVALAVPVRVCGVLVHPGDLVFADQDGGVVVPAALEEAAVAKALAKVAAENTVRDALAAGMTVAEAFRKFGVL